MTNPRNSYDPAAALFIESARNAKYPQSPQVNEFSPIDNLGTTPNSATMSELSRQELKAELAASEAKVDARLANFDTSIKTGFAEARTEMAELRADMHKMHADIKTWTLATMLTIIGTMLAAIFGIATIFNNASKAAAPSPQQPIIIYAQPSANPTAPLPAAPPR